MKRTTPLIGSYRQFGVGDRRIWIENRRLIPCPGGPYSKVVVLKDLPPPKESGPRTKPRFIPNRFFVSEQAREEAERPGKELRAKTPPEELAKPLLPQQSNTLRRH
jgi:hypothetical protein